MISCKCCLSLEKSLYILFVNNLINQNPNSVMISPLSTSEMSSTINKYIIT